MSDIKLKDVSELINVSIPFLFSEIPMSELTNILDKNGCNLLHQAVLLSNVDKVKDLVKNGFPVNLQSFTNKVNMEKSVEPYIPSTTIAFNMNGYTPLHLSLFLYDIYSKYSGKQEFFIQKRAQSQILIIDYLLDATPESFSLEDSFGFSIIDYCFLLENTNLINKFFAINSSFSGLKRVNPDVALLIAKSEYLSKINNNEKINNNVIDSLEKFIKNKKINQSIIYKKTILNKI